MGRVTFSNPTKLIVLGPTGDDASIHRMGLERKFEVIERAEVMAPLAAKEAAFDGLILWTERAVFWR
jgi:hypothetical protein